jgi:aminotransferase in exopolysaccharide biosynthesis
MNYSSLASQILDAVTTVIQNGKTGLHEPEFKGNEYKYLSDCIETSMVSTIGDYVTKFEKQISNFTESKFAVAVCNGTSALHLALLSVGIKPNDEVLISPLTFIATANAIAYCGATPHFVDCESETLGIDPKKLRKYLLEIAKVESGRTINKNTGNPIKAIMPMHCYGIPSRMKELTDLANEFSLTILEDAAESLGSLYHGKHTGTIGLVGVYSFNGNKIITTGGGGVLVTNDETIARKAKHLSTTARLSHRWNFQHDEVGFNYRMPNLNAALGVAQLEKINEKIERKRNLHAMYANALRGITGVSLLNEPLGCRSNYWLNTIILEKDFHGAREEILGTAFESNVAMRPPWELLNYSIPYKDHPSMKTDCAEDLARRIINIPSSESLGLIKNV